LPVGVALQVSFLRGDRLMTRLVTPADHPMNV